MGWDTSGQGWGHGLGLGRGALTCRCLCAGDQGGGVDGRDLWKRKGDVLRKGVPSSGGDTQTKALCRRGAEGIGGGHQQFVKKDDRVSLT